MEKINVNEELNDVVADVVTLTTSGKTLKVAAGTGLTVLGCVAVYQLGKAVKNKIVKSKLAKAKESSEEIEVITEPESTFADSKD